MHPSVTIPAILHTVPCHKVKVWGGYNLLGPLARERSPLQSDLPLDTDPVGEAWEVADIPEGSSFVKLSGTTQLPLREFIARHPAAFPALIASQRYPLLIKTLDAARDLSVQVHPGSQHLHLFEGREDVQQKDECWIILACEPGGSILHGFQDGVTRESFEAAVRQKADLSRLLRRHEVTPGEVIHVPPGTVHAICAGVTLLEVQQPSDTTFRVWDYERPGLDGALRPLHLEDALKVLEFGPQPPITQPLQSATNVVEPLIETAHYRITRITVGGEKLNLSSLLRCASRATSLFALERDVALYPDGIEDPIPLAQGHFSLCTSTCTSLAISAFENPMASLLLIETI